MSFSQCFPIGSPSKNQRPVPINQDFLTLCAQIRTRQQKSDGAIRLWLNFANLCLRFPRNLEWTAIRRSRLLLKAPSRYKQSALLPYRPHLPNSPQAVHSSTFVWWASWFDELDHFGIIFDIILASWSDQVFLERHRPTNVVCGVYTSESTCYNVVLDVCTYRINTFFRIGTFRKVFISNQNI